MEDDPVGEGVLLDPVDVASECLVEQRSGWQRPVGGWSLVEGRRPQPGLRRRTAGFSARAAVIDGFTDLMVELYGEEAAVCPRTVARVVELAVNSPVIVEGEVWVDDGR
ncbi:MAG: hypothetical protein M3Q82_10210 [Actinomycetota bacterium]|nr:hypothetical protein [Actinomycetota bacterium]